MKKINVVPVVRDHLSTLHGEDKSRISVVDILVFYGSPVAVAGLIFFVKLRLSGDFYTLSITFFGIFIALLLNIQVAIFSIFQRGWSPLSDSRLQEIRTDALKDRRSLLSELNANLSYLILVCGAALVLSIVAYIVECLRVWPALLAFVYFHFTLTLMMVVKRSHALFKREYAEPGRDEGPDIER
jgi:hypothetical protein